MNKSIIVFSLLLFTSYSYGQSQNDKGVLPIVSSSVYIAYCISDDKVLSFAKTNGIPICYPSLIINNVVINNEANLNVIRKCFHGSNNSLLGPYHIAKFRRYTSLQATQLGIKDVSKDGAVSITLRKKEILDITILEQWDNKKCISK